MTNDNLKVYNTTDKWNKDVVNNPFVKESSIKIEDNNTEYEYVNHPSHYNQYDVEVLDMIAAIWGPKVCSIWCEITAFKYRMRMGLKPGNSVETDLNKERIYLNESEKYRKIAEERDKK